MDKEFAIIILKELWKYKDPPFPEEEIRLALQMAIEALVKCG